MNKLKAIVLLIASAPLLLCACKGGGTSAALSGGDTVRLEYARRLTIVKYDGYTVATLHDPWNKGRTLHTYILVADSQAEGRPPGNDKAEKLAAALNADGQKAEIVHTPLRRAIITTSAHCALLDKLGKRDAVRGICDAQYINLPWVKQRLKEGRMADCGNATTPTLEKIIEADADAILISPFQNSGGYGRLDEWGRPIIEVADYMETSALGRAEWMKLYGMLFGAEHEADSIWDAVKRRYNGLKAIAQKSGTRPSVIIDKVTGPVWYVPGGQSTLGRVIADANAAYPFAGDANSGSLPLTFEAVLAKAKDADVWMLRHDSRQPATYSALLAENPGYAQFKAFRERRVYGCPTAGGSTFYEDTPFSPDLLLRDFIIITHPGLAQLGAPKYFKPLK